MRVHKIRLIDNTYDLGVAEQLVKKFIAAKISFIEDRIKETPAEDKDQIHQLKSRMQDLKAETRSFDLFIEENDVENVEMEIGSTIVMSIKDVESE